MKKMIPIWLGLLLLFILPTQSHAAMFDEVKSIIQNDYVGEIKGDLNRATTIDEMIEMLDPYSAYFTKEEFDAFTNSIEMTTVGIGVVIEKHEKGILIVDVIEGGSASKAGVVPGDIIIAVNGQSTADLSIEQTQALILGEANTTVEIKFLKEDGSTTTKKITRLPFSLPNVTSELLYGNVGYIALSSFSDNGTTLVKNAYTKLKTQGATSFILDLQNNGGGYVSTAEKLIGMFPNAPYAYKLKESTNTYLEPSISQSVKFPKDTRLLVNRFSASASEMTAAALLDQNAAIVYGETTYGKGTMQSLYPLSDGSYLKLTMAEFFGPKGTVVKNVGLKPHIVTTTDPIFKAHYDSVAKKLSNYKEGKALLNVPTSKTFKISFNQPVKNSLDTNAIELVELSGSKVEVNLEINNNQVIVKPVKPLKAGYQYMLIAHPTIQASNGKALKSGQYLHITVKES
ncbi:carboxyl-terminal processing protease [Ureibacillus xyleni]|uniref:Carboxyl-terminal processing protease n=1 Tax=Ureibacillus xyleni TaxID=614648 RepID=A0A285RB37_9BACL|nr:S41 family peptidase [Ureibacillus xyleni]SOB90909.1 carboxyl-terminal processing protease [Ureibacillus xyleni]